MDRLTEFMHTWLWVPSSTFPENQVGRQRVLLFPVLEGLAKPTFRRPLHPIYQKANDFCLARCTKRISTRPGFWFLGVCIFGADWNLVILWAVCVCVSFCRIDTPQDVFVSFWFPLKEPPERGADSFKQLPFAEYCLFSPVGIQGNRFHYWTYTFLFFPRGRKTKWKTLGTPCLGQAKSLGAFFGAIHLESE